MKAVHKIFIALTLALSGFFAVPASVQAGNIWLTGHDADLHCAFGAQCNHFGVAINFARLAAPTPGLPLLFLTSGGVSGDLADAEANAVSRGRNTVQGAGSPFPYVLLDPTDASFAGLALTTTAFSAIVIASDTSCGGCDNNAADIVAINARTADIATFFNDGGGLVYFSGASRFADYYDSVPVGATAVPVSAPFSLTAAGIGIGLQTAGVGGDDANCCATHNSFSLPGAGSALIVAETDAAGVAETLFAAGAVIGDGGIIVDPGLVPEPTTTLLFGLGLAGLAAIRRKRAKS